MRPLHGWTLALTLAALVGAASPDAVGAAGAAGCSATAGGLAPSRIIEIDTAGGPLFGDHTRFAKEPSFLRPKEVVLTFDDGPMPWITRAILDTLDRHCAKATFFSVGKMALTYPSVVQDVIARGHTLGTHTQTHPLNLKRLKHDAAVDEIERGFASVALAAGRPITPFFRFPGLSDSPALLEHLQKRQVASFTVDVISDDSFIADTARLVRVTLARIEARQGGIVLFHDIKAATARALPQILAELKARGYSVVHMRPKGWHRPLEHLTAELAPRLAKPAGGKALVPFYGAASVMAEETRGTGAASVPVEALAPAPRSFTVAALEPRAASRPAPSASVSAAADSERARPRKPKSRAVQRGGDPAESRYPAASTSWATSVYPSKHKWPGD